MQIGDTYEIREVVAENMTAKSFGSGNDDNGVHGPF